MHTEFIWALEAQRPSIRKNWEHLLRVERVNSPLAHPDTLIHLLDVTLDELFRTLRAWSLRRHPTRTPAPSCPCRRNPLLAYFAAGRQALHEALIVTQAAVSTLTPQQRDDAFACLDQAFGAIARREIESFCAICQLRPEAKDSHAAPPPCLAVHHAITA